MTPYPVMASCQISAGLSPLLTADTVEKLRRSGISTVVKLSCSAPELVARGSGQALGWANKLQHDMLRRFSPHAVSGRTLLKEAEEHLCIFPFGHSSVDAILKGGVFTGEITELWGASGSGKTQLCSRLASQVARACYTVCYVDGGAGGFSSELLLQCLQQSGCGEADIPAVMERVRVFRAFSVFDLLSMLHSTHYNISHQVSSYYSNLHLLIIDPLTLYLAPHMATQQNHGQMLMLQVAKALATLYHNHSMAVVCCNNVVSAGAGGLKPALGQTWFPIPTTRLHLSAAPAQGASQHLRVTVSKSPRQVAGCCAEFQISPPNSQIDLEKAP